MQTTGRPTKYRKKFLPIVSALAELGATDEKIAQVLDVNTDTIYEWRNKHPEFSEATKIGKQIADTKVEKSLFERAVGYSHDDVDIRAVSLGNNQGSEIVQTPITKHYPPDPVSCIFWLKNRQPDKWRDVQRSEIAMIAKLEVSGSSTAELQEQLAKRGLLVPGMDVETVKSS